MKISRLLVLVLGLIWSATAMAEVAEEQIRRHLPGTWQVSYSEDGVSVRGTSTYRNDGRVTYDGAYYVGEQVTHFQIRANWTVAGDRLTTEVTESSAPEIVPVGTMETDTVLAIDERSYTYVDNGGAKMTETRIATP